LTWIAIARYGDWQPGVKPGFYRVIATEGGIRKRGARRRSFLVPAAEYNQAPKPFVIDTNKHQEEA
jgi:hypothetical protein